MDDSKDAPRIKRASVRGKGVTRLGYDLGNDEKNAVRKKKGPRKKSKVSLKKRIDDATKEGKKEWEDRVNELADDIVQKIERKVLKEAKNQRKRLEVDLLEIQGGIDLTSFEQTKVISRVNEIPITSKIIVDKVVNLLDEAGVTATRVTSKKKLVGLKVSWGGPGIS